MNTTSKSWPYECCCSRHFCIKYLFHVDWEADFQQHSGKSTKVTGGHMCLWSCFDHVLVEREHSSEVLCSLWWQDLSSLSVLGKSAWTSQPTFLTARTPGHLRTWSIDRTRWAECAHSCEEGLEKVVPWPTSNGGTAAPSRQWEIHEWAPTIQLSHTGH